MTERLGGNPERDMAVEAAGDQPTPVLCPKKEVALGLGLFSCKVLDCDQIVRDFGIDDSSTTGECAIEKALAPNPGGQYRHISDILPRFPDRADTNGAQ